MSGTNKVCWPWLVCLPEKLRGVYTPKEGIIIWHSNAEHFIHIQFLTEQWQTEMEGKANALKVSVGSEKYSGNSGVSELWSPLALMALIQSVKTQGAYAAVEQDGIWQFEIPAGGMKDVK